MCNESAVGNGRQVVDDLNIRGSEDKIRLPPSPHLLLHPGGRDRGRRARHGQTVGRVDDGDGMASAGGRGLMQLQGRLLSMVKGGRHKGR